MEGKKPLGGQEGAKGRTGRRNGVKERIGEHQRSGGILAKLRARGNKTTKRTTFRLVGGRPEGNGGIYLERGGRRTVDQEMS